MLAPEHGVVPATTTAPLDEAKGGIDSYPHLAKWWEKASKLWEEHRSDATKLTLLEQMDFQGKLSLQLPTPPERVVYSASGNRVVAARLRDPEPIVEHSLYWAPVSSGDEGLYLTAILNSDEIHKRVLPLMAEGLYGPRHIDKYILRANIPYFDPDDALHRQVCETAREAEETVAKLDSGTAGFQRQRRVIREHLAEVGLMARLDEAVKELLA